MTELKRGDVVLVYYPLISSGLSERKLRPAVVVQCDKNNLRLNDVILIPLTSKTKEKLEENLMELMWGVDSLDKMRERVILVPGNHDVNLRFASCEKYDWNRDDKAWIDKAMPVKSDEDREDFLL